MMMQPQHVGYPTFKELFAFFYPPPPPPSENGRRQLAESLPVEKRELIKMLLRAFTFNLTVIGAFLGAKMKFNIIDYYGQLVVSIWAILIHFAMGQHFIFTITSNRDLIRESGCVREVVCFLVAFIL
ncbi:hypothetical protein L195_g050152, partial [Trifolium pratense]